MGAKLDIDDEIAIEEVAEVVQEYQRSPAERNPIIRFFNDGLNYCKARLK
jgi:hypothetical protein